MRRPPLTLGIARASTLILVGAATKTAFSLVIIAAGWSSREMPWVTLGAWVLLAGAVVVALLLARKQSERLSREQVLAVVVLVAIAVVTEGIASGHADAISDVGSIAISASTALVLCAAYRPGREALVAALGVITAVTVAFIIAGSGVEHWQGSTRIVASVLIPALALGIPLRLYSRDIERSYRLLADETPPTARRGRGSRRRTAAAPLSGAPNDADPLTAPVLALLDGIASGRIPVPLSSLQAAQAAQLGTAIRARHDDAVTWLVALVAEHPPLAGRVQIDDALGLARFIDRGRRATLTAVLLLIVGRRERDRPVRLSIEPAAGLSTATAPGFLRLHLDAEQFSRHGDPALWPLLAQLGRQQPGGRSDHLEVDVDILLEPDSSPIATR